MLWAVQSSCLIILLYSTPTHTHTQTHTPVSPGFAAPLFRINLWPLTSNQILPRLVGGRWADIHLAGRKWCNTLTFLNACVSRHRSYTQTHHTHTPDIAFSNDVQYRHTATSIGSEAKSLQNPHAIQSTLFKKIEHAHTHTHNTL